METEGILRVSWDETSCPDLAELGTREMAKGTTQLPEEQVHRIQVHGGSGRRA